MSKQKGAKLLRIVYVDVYDKGDWKNISISSK